MSMQSVNRLGFNRFLTEWKACLLNMRMIIILKIRKSIS
jgi:hypothetical protein